MPLTEDLVWDGESIVWGSAPLVETLWPPLGERAPIMLAYLPEYEQNSPTIQMLMQAEGYALDPLWIYARDLLPLVAEPLNCPEWALGWWENMLSIGGHTSWEVADRRTAIAAYLKPVVTPNELLAFVAAQARCDVEDLEISWDGFDVTVDFPGTFDAEQEELVHVAVHRVLPAHLTYMAEVLAGDDFERSDRALDGDNGWDAAASYQIIDGAATIDSVVDAFDQFAIHAGAATGQWELHTHIPDPIPAVDPGVLTYKVDLMVVGLWTAVADFYGLLCRCELSFEPDGTWIGGTMWVDYDSPTEGGGTPFNEPLVTTVLLPGDAVVLTVDLDALGNISMDINGETFAGMVPLAVLADLPTANWGLGAVRYFTGGLVRQDTPPIEEFVGPGF